MDFGDCMGDGDYEELAGIINIAKCLGSFHTDPLCMNTPETLDIGILGGGQLGMMLIEEGRRAMKEGRFSQDMHFAVLDEAGTSCDGVADEFVSGRIRNAQDVLRFGRGRNVVTIEIENIHALALRQLEMEQQVAVFPQPHVIERIQDKGVQKDFYRKHGIPTPEYLLVDNLAAARSHPDFFPAFIKKRRGGYDGTGVKGMETCDDSVRPGFNVPLVLEKMITDMRPEISVIVARSATGQVRTYPSVEMACDPRLNLVDRVASVSSLSQTQEREVAAIAAEVITQLDMIGILAVEMFIDKTGKPWVNEVAPRPHNSGHLTIEGHHTSQFLQHLLAITGEPLGDTSLLKPAVMINLVRRGEGRGIPRYLNMNAAADMGGYVHLYGKTEAWDGRKMGHITVTADSLEEAHAKATAIQEMVSIEIEDGENKK